MIRTRSARYGSPPPPRNPTPPPPPPAPLEFEARARRIGVAMNDPHQIRPVRLGEPARHLHRDPLARPHRKPVHIADQRHHAASPPPLFRNTLRRGTSFGNP